MTIRDEDLKAIAELSRFVDQYGVDSVMRLAGLIRNPEFANDIATALENVAQNRPRRKVRGKPQGTDRIGMGILNELRETDPQKHAAIAEFREGLVSGTLLKTMPDIRRFARVYGLAIGNASSRRAAIAPLLRSISEWETASILALLKSTADAGSDDRSLERWRDLIVQPNRPEE